MLFAQFNGNGIGSNLEWNERFSLKNSSIYALFIYNFIKSTRQSFCIPSDFGKKIAPPQPFKAKKLHPIRLPRQKNCTLFGCKFIRNCYMMCNLDGNAK